MSDWMVEHRRGPAGVLHAQAAADLAGADARRVRILEAEAPALVLGSAQPARDVAAGRAERAGVEIVRRRSGGSAVLVGPGQCLWIDVTVPAGDPLWDPDVGRATWWLGEVWAAALRSVTGGAGVAVHRGGMVRSDWSASVCFAGLGPGEVTADPAPGRGTSPGRGPKVVGVAQRRVRAGVLLQTAALLTWEPANLVDLLAIEDREAAAAALAPMAAGLGPDRVDQVRDAFIDQLGRVPRDGGPGPGSAPPAGGLT